MFALAQISSRDDLIFHILLIPGGLWLAAIGIRAIRRRKLHLRKRGAGMTGPGAVLGGIIAVVTGILCVLASIRMLWQWVS